MSDGPNVLMRVTRHGDIPGVPTTWIGFPQLSEPYDLFTGAGADVTIASPRGGA